MNQSVYVAAMSIGILSISSAFASPEQATEQIKTSSEKVLQILKKSNGSNDAAVRKEAEDYATPYFDFNLMTRVAVGAPWNKASAAQQQTLVQEFRKMLIRTYASQMLRYKNAQLEVKNSVAKNGGAMLRGKQAVEVRAIINIPGQKPIQVVFSTYQDGGRYKIYNVSFEGVFNLVQSQKQQFKPILDTKGIEGLITELKAKNGSK